ncbi:MAG: hypothetical protein U5K75_02250 [Ahrensia sp.]|nr:hypothetical protein [Ahrensia sp.]
MAEETGHYFNVRNKKLIFTNFKSIDGRGAALSVFHGDRALMDYSFQFKTVDSYSKGKAAYLDQNKKKKNEHEESDGKIKTGDTLFRRAHETKSHAAAAQSEMHFKTRKFFRFRDHRWQCGADHDDTN